MSFFDSNGPLRGKKRSLHEGGIRIPMIVRVPPSLRTARLPAPGTVVRTPVAVWDLLPTFAELAGRPHPPRHRRHLVRRDCCAAGDDAGHSRLYWQHRGERLGEAVRFGKWKAVRYDRGPGRALPARPRHPASVHDVSRRHPAVARKAARLMHHAVT